MIFGREREIATLDVLNSRREAQFVAIYGRRRIGKTWLIEKYFKSRSEIFVKVLGEYGKDKQTQLKHFRRGIELGFGTTISEIFSWHNAFEILAGQLQIVARNNPSSVCVFFDELPWLDTHRSDMVSSLAHAWEALLKDFSFLRLVVCGSATTWMIKNVVNRKGGLYGRINETIPLRQFTLHESKSYLFHKHGIDVSAPELLEIYMTFGGVARYLDMIRSGESIRQAVSRVCFGDGSMVGEYDKIFRNLFDEFDMYEKIVENVAQKKGGLTRREIMNTTKMKSGGHVTRCLTELCNCEFLAPVETWDEKKKNLRYILCDQFLLFYFRWMHNQNSSFLTKSMSSNEWFLNRKSASYSTWAGYAFENICLMHILVIKKVLGLDTIACKASKFKVDAVGKKRILNSSNIKGCEIDLIIDREDGWISICEIKHYDGKFSIDAGYTDRIMERTRLFKSISKTEKNIQHVFITTNGVVDNSNLRRLNARVLVLDDLFG